MPSEIIFLTGASGFLGSHILTQLLKKGSTVRAAVRDKKAAAFKKTYESYGAQLEVVPIADISTAQFPDALKGVTGVIHTAAPLPERQSGADAQYKGAVEGVLNVIRQAEKAGVTKIVVTSTILTAATPQMSFTDQDWFPASKEELLKSDGFNAYQAAKTLAEKEVWSFADAHPHVEITTLNPPYLYGPLAEGFTLATPEYSALSTDMHIYRWISPDGTFPAFPLYIDVRDAAKAHILALSSPPTAKVGHKRIILSTIHEVEFAKIIELIRTKKPELKDRITKTTPPEFPFKRLPFNVKRLEEVVGFKEADFTPLESTVLDTIDSLLALEKQWIAAGYEIKVPPS